MPPQVLYLSHSQIRNLACGRKFEYQQLRQLERNVSALPLEIGKTFHAAMAAALHASLDPLGLTNEAMIAAAHNDMEDYLQQPQLEFEPDISVDEIRSVVSAMLHYYIPLIELNKTWRVANANEIFPLEKCEGCHGYGEVPDKTTGELIECEDCDGQGQWHDDDPMIEYEFAVKVTEDVVVKGIVDAVLIHLDSNEPHIIDWKTMRTPMDKDVALLDGQLQLYAAMLNLAGAKIRNVMMWQMNKQTPKPATITPAKKNIGVGNQITTWDVWFDTLPMDKKVIVANDIEQWKKWGEEKLHLPSYFSHQISDYLDETANALALENLQSQVRLINYYIGEFNEGRALPAIANAGFDGICTWCSFKMICIEPRRYGTDEALILQEHYRARKRR